MIDPTDVPEWVIEEHREHEYNDQLTDPGEETDPDPYEPCREYVPYCNCPNCLGQGN